MSFGPVTAVEGFDLSADGLLTAMIWAVAASTLASGAAYVAATLRRPRATGNRP